MKTAICFTGTGRSLKYTIDNLKKTLINRYSDCDVFVHLAKTEHTDAALGFLSLNEVKKITAEEDEEIDLSGLKWQANWPAGLHSGPNPKQTYLNMLLSRKKCGEMLRTYSTQNDIKYDRVIFSRLDIEFFYDIPGQFDLECISVPDFHNFDIVQGKGCNDRFAIGNDKNMAKYFNLYDNIRHLTNMGHPLHGESTLHLHLLMANVEIKRRFIRFTRIRPNGFRQDERLKDPCLQQRDY